MGKQREQQELARSGWASVRNGRVSAAGAPRRGRLAQWAAEGVTDVVTLQRADEHAAWLPSAVAEAGLAWHHLPLSGRRLDRLEDRVSLARVSELVALLDATPARSLMFHCAAGLHRTGVSLYLLMHAAGLSRDEAIDKITQARPLTAKELCRQSKRGSLLEVAERLCRGR